MILISGVSQDFSEVKTPIVRETPTLGNSLSMEKYKPIRNAFLREESEDMNIPEY